jgi:hypothetical protein
MKKIRPTLRNKANKNWSGHGTANIQYLGMGCLCTWLYFYFNKRPTNTTMNTAIEIGSHMGEGLQMLASTGLFNKIHVIEPFEGEEEFNEMFGWSWDEVRAEWELNTRHFKDIIKLHESYSYKVADNFIDGTIDFVYIDGDHNYEAVKRDIQLYLPKIKDGGIIAGHDYHEEWPGVIKAVEEVLGKPNHVHKDSTWVHKVGKGNV